ncbi:hypothetical protein A1Q1_08138 [Trichosporon asahii var. asahii CBS 2479]|uniref:Uncharacterized protein n=1 Tax=Trichosporon asahii var. asahii (strain ATCC 90039 / CBS 2479 / JCM 2466 / KCTC 7840 / NBRC 103889/ NCYC 2677 / UAMH 7654) TaxID=1186058 RepID=J6F600_TRIAS|nr:hypothetical protein A1Q1_08138 [Trichosporon asahii var. asahii CBS 2479]EJT50732.1 hypothetical protein A1Q1_08138 [Trichosporon asahii var. asahii CBS 2479]
MSAKEADTSPRQARGVPAGPVLAPFLGGCGGWRRPRGKFGTSGSGQSDPRSAQQYRQAAAVLTPTQATEEIELAWAADHPADDEDRDAPARAKVIEHAVRGLQEGGYDRRAWLRSAALGHPRGRARDVIVKWGTDNSSPEAPTPNTFMYRMAAHECFSTILKMLLFDTSNQLFPLALSMLVTILPFSLPLLTKHVPTLMVILGRAVSWRDRPFVDAGLTSLSAVTRTPEPAPNQHWEVCAGRDSEILAPNATEKRVVELFLVCLYGAWPSNVIAFTRNPEGYLNSKGVEALYAVPWNEVWEANILSTRLVPLISDFQLHPSIITFTSDAELDDDSRRWDKWDPSEFVSMAHLMSHASEPDQMFDFFRVPVPDKPLPTVEMKREQSLLPEEGGDDIERLKEENELLRLEALYAERLRKQFVYLTRPRSTLSHQRAESSQAQAKHVKWQEQLRDKVSSFREERRQWQTEGTALKSDIAELKSTVQKQRDELAQVKNEDSDVQKLRDAKAAVETFQSRCFELEGMLRARDRVCREQADQIRHLENRVVIASSTAGTPANERAEKEKPERQPQTMDREFCMHVAENARRKAEKLERENLELTVELERLKRMALQSAAETGTEEEPPKETKGGARQLLGDLLSS